MTLTDVAIVTLGLAALFGPTLPLHAADPSPAMVSQLYLKRSGDTWRGNQNANGFKLTLDADKNSYLYSSANDTIDLYTNATLRLELTTSVLDSRVRLTNGAAVLNLGTSAATGHSLTIGDVIDGGALEVDGILYADSDIRWNNGNGILSSGGAVTFPTANHTINGLTTFFGVSRASRTTLTLAAAATVIAITRTVHTVDCDAGGNTIGTITGGSDGQLLTLIFVDATCTITDTDDGGADTIDLTGTATNQVTADDLVMQFVRDGTLWREAGESAD